MEESDSLVETVVKAAVLIYAVVCFKYTYPFTAHAAAAKAHVQVPFGL